MERKCSNTLLLSDNEKYSFVFHTCIRCVRLFVKCIAQFNERQFNEWGLIAPTSYIEHTSYDKDIFQFNKLCPITSSHNPLSQTHTHVLFITFKRTLAQQGLLGKQKYFKLVLLLQIFTFVPIVTKYILFYKVLIWC